MKIQTEKLINKRGRLKLNLLFVKKLTNQKIREPIYQNPWARLHSQIRFIAYCTLYNVHRYIYNRN